ncbi:hypothetical protein GCK72_023230 [Caenorhabditis remanei]|uniref:C2H2-type domain-containing protein n=1 Tax=Caenorhabditis remanei TaxID=31234 RepID=A0A6A5FW35_CAERE|nr:hypothetical protein GCK72_023230 [Caenorhabditis remanei]KAF1746773.1 hypothetical protein GCK72_023230 [Caenorhabditis remanei]
MDLYPMNLSDEEIDVLHSDEEELMHATEGDEQYMHAENVYMDEEGAYIYEDEIQYRYEDEETYDNNPDYNSQENPEFIDEHYLNTDIVYVEQKKAEENYHLLENPDIIELHSQDDRLKKFPEMNILPAFHRLMKFEKNGKPIRKDPPKHRKRLNAKESTVNALLVANKIYPGTGVERRAPEPFVPLINKKLKSDSALSKKFKVKMTPAMKKLYRPKPRLFPEPRDAYLIPTDEMTPLPDRYFQKRLTLTAEQVGFNSDCVACETCNFVWRQKALHESHKSKHDPNEEPKDIMSKNVGLLCPMPHCMTRCDSIATVVKHMKTIHNILDIAFERIIFKNFIEFKLWKTELERLTMSKFSRSSGKQNVFSKSTYYQCRLSGKRNCGSINTRKRDSKKIGRTCTAFFQIRENDDGTVLLRGCTKHSGHGRDIQALPITEDIKMEIAHKLIEGMDEVQIVEQMREESDPSDRRYYLQNYEVRNVFNKIDSYKLEFKRRMTSGEKIPNLGETYRSPDDRHGVLFPVIKAKLARSKYPVTANPEEIALAEALEVQSGDFPQGILIEEPNAVFEPLEDEMQSGVDESMSSEPLDSEPLAPDDVIKETLLPEEPNPVVKPKRSKRSLQKLLNTEGVGKREEVNVETNVKTQSAPVTSEARTKRVSPIGRNTARKQAAKRRKIEQEPIRYESTDTEYEEDTCQASTSNVLPTRISSRLQQKRAKLQEEEAAEVHEEFPSLSSTGDSV